MSIARSFSHVLRKELRQIAIRRNGDGKAVGARLRSVSAPCPNLATTEDERLKAARGRARNMELTGLAFSGGGIRSATFCLGILTALADLRLLKRFDYLSTVSGGGYIGAWLAAWIKREGTILHVEEQLKSSRANQAPGRQTPGDKTPREAEPEPICHLRAYSNYLAPRLGGASLDGWTLAAIYARNLILNQCILLPVTLIALLLPRLLLVLLRPHWEVMASWAGALGAARWVENGENAQVAAVIITVVPPLVLLALFLLVIVGVGLLGRGGLNEAQREWWASQCGRLLRAAALWGAVMAVALLSVPFLHWAGPLMQSVLGTSWALASIGGVLAGRSPKTGGPGQSWPWDMLVQAAPYVFLIGLLMAMSAGLSLCLDQTTLAEGRYWKGVGGTSWRMLLVAVGCLLVALLFSWRLGVNTFSLQATYQNRLVRCYLGASRLKSGGTAATHGMPCNTGPPPRRPDPLTGFDARDDLPLRNLTIRPGKPWDELKDLPEGRRPYRGPFLLLNTAMNLVRGDELAWQERMAEAFVLSPWYCGSRTTGYRPARAYAGGLTLGTAVAISGAAVAPNMGYHSSPAVTALLTIFNVRLGGWFGNPKRDKWKRSDPSGLRLLWRELTGDTRADRKYVYLSDGGHFDDLGVYELVRRHCRYIVACDGGADPEYGFGDLGGLIRKCRSDLGVPIEIDVQPIRPRLGRGHSKWHCAVGRIRYDCIDPAAEPGLLLYIKTSLTGDEPCDVLNYAIEHGPFPHQSTLNQFFEESQFESYRALGQHVGLEVFGAAARDADIDDAMSDETHRRIAGRLFANLRRRWFAAPRDEKSPPAGLHADFRSNDGLLTV